MEQFIKKLDTLLDNDLFADLDGNFLSANDLEVKKTIVSLFAKKKRFDLSLTTKKVIRKISRQISRRSTTNSK